MCEISKERVEALASNILECHDVKPSEVKALAGLALLALRERAEPVSWDGMPFTWEQLEGMHGADFANGYVRGWERKCESVEMKGPLYTAPPAPPAPVVAGNIAITRHFDTIALEAAREIMCDVNRRHEFLGGEVQLLSRIQCRIDDACRAAMLAAAPGKN
ncbi:hypothetical protein ACXYXE_004089 [Cronobacter dublinensis]